MKRLFIIRTPLQLFNAFEAKNRFFDASIKNELLVVYGSEKDLIIIKKMLVEFQDWDRIIFQKFYGLSKKLYAFELKKYFSNECYLDVFTGMIYHIPLHLMNTVLAKNYWLLDDGNETRLIVKNLNEGNYYSTNKSKFFLGINQNPNVLKKLRLFTLYSDLETNHPIFLNDYKMFKQRVNFLEIRKNSCLIIGSNLIGTYLNCENSYLDILKILKEKYNNLELWYAPHRYISEETLKKIEQIGYLIFKYDCILEVAQMFQGWRFEKYLSIRSTAIDTLKVLYGINGYYVRLPKQYFISDSKWRECEEIWSSSDSVYDLNEF